MQATYVILERDRVVATYGRLANARRARKGIGGRRIVKLDRQAPAIELRDWRGGRFRIHGLEVV